ncbi:phosphoinositide phospholipase C 6 [Amaranthus tricolor]|uniref:phosphoinositide phospholipase C 6 n=1 Tax=Amaranthus tricolor TaxID=29722 RepID=UPI00258E61D2|nr:phosphoinositide phospholipase C 6 [Amaranthus tricolor]
MAGSSSTHHNYKMFMCFNRKFKINDTRPPFDVVEAFTIYSEKNAHMNQSQLRRFMIEFQGEDLTEDESNCLLNEILRRRRHLTKFTKHQLSLEDFFFFLFSDDLNSPLNTQVHQDMTAPMQHYFIFTGHNSYLTGNQLSSDCSDVPIIKALQRGVRVIELDIWPNSAKDDVNVLHGRTLTTPVPLIKCLKSIKEHAFAASSYPVIITLEDHLTPDLQAKVAKMVTEVFGEMLFCPESKHLEQFPSPEELKFRIILSTKPPKEYLEEKQAKDKGSASPGSSGDDAQPNEATGDSESDPDDDDSDVAANGKPDQSIAPQYKRLIAIHAGKPKNGLRQALRTGLDKVRRLSLSEQALERAASNYGPDVVRFTQRNFLRIYPKGTRIRSSNYEPLVGWMHGAQMVAFNMQGYGKSLWLMSGMFRLNGGCGYVKKPDFLMKQGPNGEVFDPKAQSEVKKILKVRVYMGDGWRMDFSKTHFDTFSPPDFYVKLRILGVPADIAKVKTKIMEDEWTPVWDQEFKFALTVPELALLQIEVREYDMSEKDDFGGQACLPISELKTGIRSIRLFDRKGEKLPSVRLLMKFQFA